MQVILKPGKEKPILNRHHWIFSGAIKQLPQFTDGAYLQVCSSEQQFLGWAYFNKRASIIGRMVSFDHTEPRQAISQSMEKAIQLRRSLFAAGDTEAYRLVNGEGDLLPGLVVDKYGEHLVMQIATLGMQQMRPFLLEWLQMRLSPVSIYEKSHLSTRKEEGLGPEEALLFGSLPNEPFPFNENGLKFLVSPQEGQKTGFFLDQREMRQQVRELAGGKRVLNCFSYTGGFSVYAAAGGAAQVDTVDISAAAIQLAEKNMALNGFAGAAFNFFAADVFQFLRENPLQYDLLILDPPAFAKKQKDVIAACRGYKEINRLAMQKLPKGAVLLTSSCSYHVDEDLFQKVVFQASIEAGRSVRIIGRHRVAADHPVNLCHPEGEYLKSLLLYIDDA